LQLLGDLDVEAKMALALAHKLLKCLRRAATCSTGKLMAHARRCSIPLGAARHHHC
jgi:hypothetical protein